jgi:FAD/FMN-containing dehydrogenase
MTSPITTDPEIRAAFDTDASGLHNLPDAVARPTSEAEVVELLRDATGRRTPVTPAGGQTSTTGASITDTGTLLSLRGLDRILDLDVRARTIRVQPGLLLGDLKRTLAEDGLFFAPDPTSENECTVGGAIACNASGARTLAYGPTRAHVRALRVALASGNVVELRRTALEKNTVGYTFAQNPIDWFIGSEGTLRVVLEAELALLAVPERVVGIAIPFFSEPDALAFVVAARESSTVVPRCLEYFDVLALELARAADDQLGWAADATAMVYVEQEMHGELEDALEAWLALAEQHRAHEALRVFGSDAEIRHMRAMRHAVPATMNERGARLRAHGGRKLSTDWAVPYRQLADAVAYARDVAARHGVAQAVIYGHAGNGHPHQNFIAHDADELARVEQVIDETLQYVVSVGGTVAAEHGIGKVKRRWLPLQMTPLQIAAMRAVKRELDPLGVLAPGNIL